MGKRRGGMIRGVNTGQPGERCWCFEPAVAMEVERNKPQNLAVFMLKLCVAILILFLDFLPLPGD